MNSIASMKKIKKSEQNDFLAYVLYDVLAGISGITSRRTIGGSFILYKEGVIFGLVADNQLYFKVDEHNKQSFTDRQCRPFTYQNQEGEDVALSYFEVPDEVVENKQLIGEWINQSCAASIRSKKQRA
ncbi:MAG: hypothetical protein RIQ54_606 [Candidatus Parcubacteria bacterium]|jgi:DNA transformation protein